MPGPRPTPGPRPAPTPAAGTEAAELHALFAREKWLLQAARHRTSIRLRYILVAVSLLLALADFWGDLFPGSWELVLIVPLLTGVANAAADLLRRRGWDAPWHFWALLAIDTAVIGGTAALLGTAGYLAIPFFLAASGVYALGLPRAARIQLLLGAATYPLARYAGYAWVLGTAAPLELIALETACLLGIGYLALRGPIRYTYRVRSTRRALAALQHGDFGARLPARALDDLGFLAVSFNASAVALGDMVRELRTQIAERERAEAQLAHQAFHDPLTGLANRVLFRERVEHALSRAGRNAERVTVLFVDLDGFKTVNDSLGHAAGDRLLVHVAERLLNATRGCDTVARLGGDEFAILLENVRETADAVRVAERAGAALAAPFQIDGAELVLGASIGIARAEPEDDGPPGARTEALLRDADVAMYEAKAQGKGRHAVFEPYMHESVLERLALEAELRHAMENGELRLVYQPVVQLDGGAITGVEALLRWESPRRGAVPPHTFIPVAEETGLIVALGRWVLTEACRQGAAWRRQLAPPSTSAQGATPGAAPFTLAVNVSGRQLQHPGIVADVEEALRDSGFPATSLVLEITESALVKDSALVLQRLHELKALGIRLAVDDFGTGYSSLGYLRRLPVDTLKIDKSFIDGIVRGRHDAELARTIIGLGATLALHCVAEGIEDAQQQAQLQTLGCELGQGFLFSKPLEASDVAGLLAARPAAELV
ncbi:MAG TPA: EAL domain-containing protein [Gemmatimonadaceae bacterium]|nr:EAL domain-containing protein [Gemmatimonadaceae bacterium]